MKKEILKFAKDLISIKSDPQNTDELYRILDLVLVEFDGFKVKRYRKDGVKSALVYNTKTLPKKFKLIFNCHLDIIPAKDFQYKPVVRDGRLYGAGAWDMKANIACVVFAFKEVAKQLNYPVGIQFVTDEEIGGFKGTKLQVEKGLRADFVLTSEPTNLNVVHKAKGVLQLRISCKGITAHGAYPWRGDNAVWKMHKFLKLLEKSFKVPKKELWKTTLNLSQIETSNLSFNKIPDDCSIGLDIRFVEKDSKKILPKIRKLLPNGFEMEIIANEAAQYVPKNNEFIKTLQRIVRKNHGDRAVLYGAQGSSDARHFAAVGVPGIEFGPIGAGIGSDDEWVDIQSMLGYYEILKDFMLELNNK